MSTPLVEVRLEGVQALERAVQDYRALIKDDAGKALAKAARLTALSLHREFRKQPPRPRAGSIQLAAQSRGYRVNTLSRSYITGYQSAGKILGGAKSGYFQISTGPGSVRFTPVLIGSKGRILKAGTQRTRGALLTDRRQLSAARSRDLAAYYKILNRGNKAAKSYEKQKARARGYLDSVTVPAGAVQLNRGALAVLRAISLREAAGRGGYLASQFLAYRGVRGVGETKFLTKDGKLAGSVAIKGDAGNDETNATVTGYLQGAARIAERNGIVGKSLIEAATVYRNDMIERINRRADRIGGGR